MPVATVCRIVVGLSDGSEVWGSVVWGSVVWGSELDCGVRWVAGAEHLFEFLYGGRGLVEAHGEVTLFGCPPPSCSPPPCRYSYSSVTAEIDATVSPSICGAKFDHRTCLTFVDTVDLEHQGDPFGAVSDIVDLTSDERDRYLIRILCQFGWIWDRTAGIGRPRDCQRSHSDRQRDNQRPEGSDHGR